MNGENTTNLDGFLKDRYTNNTPNKKTAAGFQKLAKKPFKAKNKDKK